MVGGGGGQPLLACVGSSGVTGEKGTMSKISVDCGFMEMLPACTRSHRSGNNYRGTTNCAVTRFFFFCFFFAQKQKE